MKDSTIPDILFVGNSFTHGFAPPAQFFNNQDIVDANGTDYGGVPGIFKKLTANAGRFFNVTIEASCGQTLEGHFDKRADIIGGRRWDIVVLQELSVRPLPQCHGGEPGRYRAGATQIVELIRRLNPSAELILFETWASPTSIREQHYPEKDGLHLMQNHLRESVFSLAASLDLSGVVRVGEAFLQAVEKGIVAADPLRDETGNKPSLWAGDHRHASAYGSYLAAAVFWAHFARPDPRRWEDYAAEVIDGLALDGGIARRLTRVAFDIDPADCTEERSLREVVSNG
jgi:hypothetical protein